MATNILMVGSKGRMGQTIIRLAGEDSSFKVSGEVDLGDDLLPLLSKTDVIIDFSHHTNTLNVVEAAVAYNKALVVGTTGHSEDVRTRILEAGEKIPMIFASNYAVGVNALFYLTRKAAEIMTGYDQEVIEMHHRMKKDAPSGTAKTLVEILCEVKKGSYEDLARHGRVGEPGERTDDEIGVHALRGGDVAGEHTVLFASQGERLELTIRSSSRETFASGALKAAAFIHGKPAKCYTMFDVLDLN